MVEELFFFHQIDETSLDKHLGPLREVSCIRAYPPSRLDLLHLGVKVAQKEFPHLVGGPDKTEQYGIFPLHGADFRQDIRVLALVHTDVDYLDLRFWEKCIHKFTAKGDEIGSRGYEVGLKDFISMQFAVFLYERGNILV